MLIYLAIFYNSIMRVSSIKRLPEGPDSEEFVLVMHVIADESLLFLKMSRMMLLMVLMALLIL